MAAFARLRRGGREVVDFVADRLEPPAVPSPAAMDELVGRLDRASYAQRQASFERLDRLGRLAGDALNRALQAGADGEYRRRIERLLSAAETGRLLSSGALREARAIRLLGVMRGAAAAGQLARRADEGPAGGKITERARRAVARGRGRPGGR
jgi:hypothetical protein